MIFHSIRWKLSLSFAGIALLTTLALGVALLLPLRAYYQDQELRYLQGNSASIADGLAPLLGKDTLQPGELETHIKFLAFLTQARVRLVDLQGSPLADSGSMGPGDAVQMAAMSIPAGGEVNGASTSAVASGSGDLIIRIEQGTKMLAQGGVFEAYAGGGSAYAAPGPAIVTEKLGDASQGGPPLEKVSKPAVDGLRFFYSEAPAPGPETDREVSELAKKRLISVAPVSNTMYGFELFSGSDEVVARSDQTFRRPVMGAGGELAAWLELSEGPAYGYEIVTNVARAWGLASLVAVLVAALAGWWISRRMSAPVVALTGVTRRMAGGDLSVRASFAQQDEYGVLGRAFNEMAGRVEGTVSTLRRFAADAAHELHTPLTALRTNLELAQTTADPREYLQRAAEQVQRLEQLTRDLLDLSRIEGGPPGPDPARLDLARLLSQVCEPLAAQAEQAGVEFRLALPAGPVWVMGQESRLAQAVSNLVENALKFTPSGGWVEVSLASADGRASLQVADNGMGIEPDDLPGLFQRFHRGRNAAGYPGSGLGLSIVKAVADAHHGTVRAECTPGRTLFTLELEELSAD